MTIERAYWEIDCELRRIGKADPNYVLWQAIRCGAPVIDFAIPLGTPDRDETLQTIESVLGSGRGRDRISAFAMELARFALDAERRANAA